MSFVLNLLTFLFFVFGTIMCIATTKSSRKDIRQGVFGSKTPTLEQDSIIESILNKTNALGVFLVILAIGFIVARIF